MGSKSDIIAFIPVRGGSKSISLKNIQPFAGQPLVYWTAKACADCNSISSTFIATDSEEIRQCVLGLGLKGVEVIGRSAESASDTASSEVALLEFAQQNKCDHIAMVQATSPLLSVEDVEGAMLNYIQSKADSLLTVVRTKRFLWEKNKDGFAHPTNYDPAVRPRRQDWPGQFVENGALYVSSREKILQSSCRISGQVSIYEMPEETYIEIDEPADWLIAEALLLQRRRSSWRDAVSDIRLLCVDIDGTLTDGGMYYTADGELMKRFDTRDAFGMNNLRKLGIEIGIVTAEDSPIVLARARKLKIEHVYVNVNDKVALLEKVLDDLGLLWENLAFVGDDLNDLPVIKKAGFSACPSDATQQVRQAVSYVCSKPGGHGAVREACNTIESRLTH